MKRYAMMIGILIMSVFAFTGCKNNNSQTNTQSSAVQSQTGMDETMDSSTDIMNQAESSADVSQTEADTETGSITDKEQKTVSGTVESIKDCQFVIYDEDGNFYQFSFEETPKGLDKVKVGDTVIVTYTGTVSEVDPFLGEVISVDLCR